MPAARLLAQCERCNEIYYCDETGKPHLFELLGGDDDYAMERMGDREIIKPKDK